MKQKINLEEEIKYYCNITIKNSGEDYVNCPLGDVISMAYAVCSKVLDLAAENTKINWIENDIEMGSDSDFSFRDSDGNWCKISIKEDSILQIKDWIK